MQYMGSKRKIAKDILPLILKDHTPDMWYIEPFVGGANIIDKVDTPKRIGCDIHKYLISMWQKIVEGWIPPDLITEDMYQNIKNNKDNYPPELVGYVGFMSFGGKWFAGYRREVKGISSNPTLKAENEKQESRRCKTSILKQAGNLKNVIFLHKSIFDIQEIKGKATIYCDPPYKGATKYKDDFDHERFYDWCIEKAKQGHNVFISEYQMPEDKFKCIFEKEVTVNLDGASVKKQSEKLFIPL